MGVTRPRKLLWKLTISRVLISKVLFWSGVRSRVTGPHQGFISPSHQPLWVYMGYSKEGIDFFVHGYINSYVPLIVLQCFHYHSNPSLSPLSLLALPFPTLVNLFILLAAFPLASRLRIIYTFPFSFLLFLAVKIQITYKYDLCEHNFAFIVGVFFHFIPKIVHALFCPTVLPA